jgi:hypothetical protein
MIFAFIDWSTSDDSRFKNLLSKSLFCDDNDDKSETSERDNDFERDEYSTDELETTIFLNESETTIFLNNSIFESETLKSMSYWIRSSIDC